MANNIEARECDDVPCPFCGLLCDDLRVSMHGDSAVVSDKGCAKSHRLFAVQATETTAPLVEGHATDLRSAIERSAEILRRSPRTAFVTAGTDVAGMRSLVELAECCGGTISHAGGTAAQRNLRVLRNTGWIATTLSEVRNRADLLVVAGSALTQSFPRFFERCFGDFDTLFDIGGREIWFLGEVPRDLPPPLRARAKSLAVDASRLAETFAVLRALHAGRHVSANADCGVPLSQLTQLLDSMGGCRYGVLAWAASELDFPHADLAVQSMCEFVTELNARSRFCVLPLGGGEADQTAQQVMAWQTGFPAQIDFAGGSPRYAPAATSATDAALHVCAFDCDRAPALDATPTILLGRAGVKTDGCAVYIPIGVPGLHHAGHMFRADNVVAVRLKALARPAWPSAAEVLKRILAQMREAG